MTGPLTSREFETLDVLETLNHATIQTELAMRLDVGVKAVSARMKHAVDAGLVSATRDEERRVVYRTTPLGRARYERALVVMAGEPVPRIPFADPLIDLPSLFAARIVRLSNQEEGIAA